jgi:hypothetical protein
VSLRRALAALPDDRATLAAAREMLRFFSAHANEYVDEERVVRATRVTPTQAERILKVLTEAHVIDCGGSGPSEHRYAPDTLLALEMKRYLQAGSAPSSSLQQGTDRFRSRYGGPRS